MQDTKCIISNHWFTGYMDKGCADFFATDTTRPFNFFMEEKCANSVFLPMWENDLRNQIKRDILVDFHLYLLLGLVSEGPYIVCKLFQYFLICWTYSIDCHPCHWLRFVLGYSASKQATCLKRFIERRKVFRSPIKYFLLS